jgi:hypothetical protein
MFTAQQYRSKAGEYDILLATALSPSEISEYRGLRQSYTALAENLDWLSANSSNTVSAIDPPRRKRKDNPEAPAEEENILRCLGAAVVLRWNTIPTKLQRELFDTASSIPDGERPAPRRDAFARFLHDHKDDAQKQQNGA